MKQFNPLRTLRFLTAMSAVSAPVSMPYGVTAMTGIATSIACSAMTAVAQSPTNTALPPLLPPAQNYGTAPSSGPTAVDAGASARSLLIRARAALSEGKNEAAAQAFAQASLAAQQSPEMASEIQQTRQQFVERGVSQQALDQAMRVAQTAPGLTSRAANALRNNNTPTLPPANGQMAGLPPAMQPPSAAQTGPVNPLRDQAAGLAAQSPACWHAPRGPKVAAHGPPGRRGWPGPPGFERPPGSRAGSRDNPNNPPH